MKTPWGDIPVWDAHVHFFSHTFFSSLAAQSAEFRSASTLEPISERLGWQMPPIESEQLAEIWAAEMDRHRVSGAALIASAPGDESSVAAAVARFPGRFHGYFMLNPIAPDAARRAHEALSSGRLQGICLFPAMHRFSVQDERLKPIFKTAAQYPGVIVFVHCGVLTVGIRKKLGLPSPFDMRFSNPIELHAVATEFPQLNFVLPHFGAGYFREALMLCDLCSNVYLDTSSTNNWIRYQPEALDLKAVFRRALDVAGAKRLMFGTDSSFFPRGWHAQVFETQTKTLDQIGLAESDARLILGENLKRLLACP